MEVAEKDKLKKELYTVAGIALAAAVIIILAGIVLDEKYANGDRLKRLGNDLVKAVDQERLGDAAILRDEIELIINKEKLLS